jgi:hypothetical protein
MHAMTVHADNFWNQLDIGRRSDPLSIRETHWGLVISDAPGGTGDGHTAEAVLKVLSIGLMFCASAPWLFDTGILGSLPFAMAPAISSGFLVTGFAVYTHAGRGFRQEIQVDGAKRELRVARRNSRNISTIRRTIAMRDVESCFLKRSKSSGSNAQLFIRLKGQSQPLAVATGREGDLVPILERTIELVKTSRATIHS